MDKKKRKSVIIMKIDKARGRAKGKLVRSQKKVCKAVTLWVQKLNQIGSRWTYPPDY